MQKLADAKVEFMQMEADGIVRRFSRPWVYPLHLVRKPDGSWQLRGDYRWLNVNSVTVLDTLHPLPNMIDFAARITGCNFFIN
jgi:hypothetical protein